MTIYDRSTGTCFTEQEYGGGLLRFLYGSVPGRILLRTVAAAPWFSRLRARYQKSSRSAKDVIPFAEQYGVDLTAWDGTHFRSFNDFFTRQLPEPFSPPEDPDVFPSVAEARLSLYAIEEDLTVPIKETVYTLAELTGDRGTGDGPDLSVFAGGTCLVFRLAVSDYHRYLYPDDGELVSSVHLPGQLHTVRPIAAKYRVYARNTRDVSVLKTDHFGTVLMAEVGAMLVGHIVNHPLPGARRFTALSEKGLFEFGGSTIVVLTGPDVRFDDDLWRETALGREVKVKPGEPLGKRLPDSDCK